MPRPIDVAERSVGIFPLFRAKRYWNSRPPLGRWPSEVLERPIACARSKCPVLLKRAPGAAESIRKPHRRKTTPRQALHQLHTL